MSVEKLDLSIVRGDTWSRTLCFTDENDAAIDVTGWTIFFTAKVNAADLDTAAVISKTITTLSEPTLGKAELLLTSTDTTQAIGSFLYDIQVKTAASEIYTLITGVLNISKDITIRTA